MRFHRAVTLCSLLPCWGEGQDEGYSNIMPCHSLFPHPNPLPEGEGAKGTLRPNTFFKDF